MKPERLVAVAVLLTAVGAVSMAWFGSALTYDGSYYLFRILNSQAPAVFHNRLGMVPFQLPVLVAQRLTDNLAVLRVVFSASYAVVVPASLYGCWLVVRHRAPRLFVWAVLADCLVLLPGVFPLVSELILVEVLAWPVLLAAACGLPRRTMLLVVPVAGLLYFLHPVAAVFLAAAAALAGFAGWKYQAGRRWTWGWAVVLAIVAVSRPFVLVDAYDRNAATYGALREQYRHAVAGRPLLAVTLMMVAAVAILTERSWAQRLNVWLRRGLAASRWIGVGGAAAVLISWAASPTAWGREIDYREPAVILLAPLVLALFIDTLAVPRAPDLKGDHVFGVVAAGVFACVLVVQGVVFGRMTADLQNRLQAASGSCISVRAAVDGARQTAIDFWSIGPMAIVYQGRRPDVLVLDPPDCVRYVSTGAVRLTSFDMTRLDRWFSAR